MASALKEWASDWTEEEKTAIGSLIAEGIKRERAEELVAELGPDRATLKAAAWVEKNLPEPADKSGNGRQ